MRAVGLKILKNRLAEYIRMAAAGETILVTDRDRVVAEIGPPRPGRAETLADAALADAVRAGWLKAPLLRTGSAPDRAPIAPLEDLLAELDEDRADR